MLHDSNVETHLEIRLIHQWLIISCGCAALLCELPVALVVALGEPEAQQDSEAELAAGASENHLDACLVDGSLLVEEGVRADDVANAICELFGVSKVLHEQRAASRSLTKTKAVAVTRFV